MPQSRVRKPDGTQYLFKFPPGLKKRLSDRADFNGSSLSAELIDAIQKSLEGYPLKILEKRISKLERMMNIS